MKQVTASEAQALADTIEEISAPAAIERALAIYQQMSARDQSVVVQARKILTQHIFAMVDRGERDEQRLTVGGLAHLKAIERDHTIKSARSNGSPIDKTITELNTDYYRKLLSGTGH